MCLAPNPRDERTRRALVCVHLRSLSSAFICVPRSKENDVLRVEGLYTEYPNERGESGKAEQDVPFTVPEGKLFTLLGPSGCGKTTTLRSIAGLGERPAGQTARANPVVS